MNKKSFGICSNCGVFAYSEFYTNKSLSNWEECPDCGQVMEGFRLLKKENGK